MITVLLCVHMHVCVHVCICYKQRWVPLEMPLELESQEEVSTPYGVEVIEGDGH